MMCPECGMEISAEELAKGGEDDKFKGYTVGIIVAAEAMGGSGGKKGKGGKLTKLSVDIGDDKEVTVVTNAKHCEEGRRIVVACVGATVGDPDDGGFVVKKQAVGGVMSQGMVCDCPMLGWKGGAKGQAAFLPEECDPGTKPPSSRPRGK